MDIWGWDIWGRDNASASASSSASTSTSTSVSEVLTEALKEALAGALEEALKEALAEAIAEALEEALEHLKCPSSSAHPQVSSTQIVILKCLIPKCSSSTVATPKIF